MQLLLSIEAKTDELLDGQRQQRELGRDLVKVNKRLGSIESEQKSIGGRIEIADHELKTTNTWLKAIDGQFDGHKQVLDRLAKVANKHDDRLDQLQSWLTDHDNRFDRLDERLEASRERLDSIDDRLDGHDDELETVNEKLDKILDLLQPRS